MLPPLMTQTTFLPARRSRSLTAASKRRGAGALRQVVRRAQRQPDALGELLLAQRHDVVELLFQDARTSGRRSRASPSLPRTCRPCPRRPATRSSTIARRRRRAPPARRSPWPGCRDRVRTMRTAARAAAAADRHQDDVDVGLLFEDLQRVGADAGDEQRLVGGMHVAQAALVLQTAPPVRAPRRSRVRTR